MYINATGQICVTSRRTPNKINNDLDVTGEEIKGMITKKMDGPRKLVMEYGSPRSWNRLLKYDI